MNEIDFLSIVTFLAGFVGGVLIGYGLGVLVMMKYFEVKDDNSK